MATKSIDIGFQRRNRNWPDADVLFLINIWEEFLGELRMHKRNRSIYMKIQARLEEIGIERDISDIKNKIQNLTKDYRKEKNKLAENGSSPSTWKFWGAVHRVLGNLPVKDGQHFVESVHEEAEGSNESIEMECADSETLNGDIEATATYTLEATASTPETIGIPHSAGVSGSHDSTVNTMPRCPPRKRQKHERSGMLAVMEGLLEEQKKANAIAERMTNEAKAVDQRVLALLQEQNKLQRIGLELQNKIMDILNHIRK